ncbi:MAG: hypothetical protein ACRD1G_02880 [Acidimicrobiales bacterium]
MKRAASPTVALAASLVMLAGCGSNSISPVAEYRAASDAYFAAQRHFTTAISALLPPVNNPGALASAGSTFTDAIKAFDSAILAIPFAGKAKTDAADLASANAALIGDIGLGLNTTGTNLINDEGKVQLDFNALNTDLGLPLPT